MTLLIVNDEMLTADSIRDRIPWKRYGIDEVVCAYSAAEAREQLANRKVDILLCDIEMPEESGIELLRWCRNSMTLCPECIFLTCHASFDYARDAIELGCRDYILIPSRDEDIGAAVEKVVHRIQDRRIELENIAYGKTVRQSIDSARRQEEEQPGSIEQTVKQVRDYIFSHYMDAELSVNSIAEIQHLHPVYLNRIFKRMTGKTISHFIVSTRMDIAVKLLAETNLPLNDIAERVGYRTYSNFFLAFKNTYQCSPIQYRDRGGISQV